MYRTASNNATLVSQIPNIITDENLMIAPGQGKTQISILSGEFCEENAFFSFLPRDKFSYNAPRNTLITPSRYHNQMLLKFDKYFASDADYIHADFLPGLWRAEPLTIKNKVCYEQKKSRCTHSRTSQEIFQRNSWKFASENESSFLSSVKGTPAYAKWFLYDKLAMVKQLVIYTYISWHCHVLT